ncbi:unnamed protein product, partial [marine sediment metagenome]
MSKKKSDLWTHWAMAMVVMVIICTMSWSDTFTVTSTDDSGPGSLREAIESANANAGLDLIAFNIPGPGPHTIQPIPLPPLEPYPILALPMITDPVIIDGYTQPGAASATHSSPATLLIEIDGIHAIDDYWVNGLSIAAGSCTIRGLVINHFGDCGIRIHENGGNTIQGNYLGTDPAGTEARPNHDSGIGIGTSGNLIGGTTPAARNVLSGNGACGIGVGGTGNTVLGNY